MHNLSIFLRVFLISFLSIFLSGCITPSLKIKNDGDSPLLNLLNISMGLPEDSLWRQNIILYDLNGDGYLDIVAPPPRKGESNQKRPFIFLWDNRDRRWIEEKFRFPEIRDIDYGSIAIGDINRDNFFDLVIASHSGKISLLINDQRRGFIEENLPIEEAYHSRAIAIEDINDDGWVDIIAVSEAPFAKEYIPKGILVALNKKGEGWDINILKDSYRIFSDSIAIGDLNGDGRKDILIAPHTSIKEDKKSVWFQRVDNLFQPYQEDLFGDYIPFSLKRGDIDGDKRDEIGALVSGFGEEGVWITSFKWAGDAFIELKEGLKMSASPTVFELFDIDRDGRDELVILTMDGFRFFKYLQNSWTPIGYFPLNKEEVGGAFELKIGRNLDGSLLFVYNLGSEKRDFKRGIRAYLLKQRGSE